MKTILRFIPKGKKGTLKVFKKPKLNIPKSKIQNIPASTASSEFAPGQFEINLNHTNDILKAADDSADW